MTLYTRKLFLFVILFGLGLCALTVFSDDPQQGEYVCPPCGNSCDNQTFHKAGACPACGMELIEKASAQQSVGLADLPLSQQAAATEMQVAIFIFEGVQIIDYTGPYEVFGGAGFQVFTVAERTDPITTTMGMSVNPTYTFQNHPVPDVLVIPGGNVPEQVSPTVAQWIQKNAAQAKSVLSVCNGAFFLARTGLLDGLEATTFARLITPLQNVAPKTKVVSDRRYVDNGKIITSAGLSSGIDGALHVIEKLLGRGYAQMTATGLEYNWDPEGKYVRAQLADRQLQTAFAFMRRFDRELSEYHGDTREWTSSWKIKTNVAPAAMLDSFGQHMATASLWQSQAGKLGSWQFKDEKDQTWNSLAAIEPISGQTNRLVFTLKVSKGTSKSATMN